MPYSRLSDLPDLMRVYLPEHAQEIFRAAFRHAWRAHEFDPRREESADSIAWAAVKRRYVNRGDAGVERDLFAD